MFPTKSNLSKLYDRFPIKLLIDLRLNYAVVSSSLVFLGFFWNNLKGFDWQYVALFIGIFFSNVFGFIINDFFDATYDLKEHDKKTRNIFCSSITKRLGKVIIYASLGLSLLFGRIASQHIYSIIALNFLAFLYSYPSIKLRNRFFWDLIIIFLWKGLIIFAGYFYFSGMISPWNLFMVGTLTMVMLLSLISQIDNQIRDFEVDKISKTNNSVQNLGFNKSSTINHGLLILFYIFSFVICYFLDLYVSMLLILLNASIYYFINSKKRRYIINFAIIWIVVIFLEHFIEYFYQQQFFFSFSIGVVASIAIWQIKRNFKLLTKS